MAQQTQFNNIKGQIIKSTLKSATTNNAMQSAFLPLFQQAETEIKRIIVSGYWLGTSRTNIRKKITEVLIELNNNVPVSLQNKKEYINGIVRKSELMIRHFYDRALSEFTRVSAIITNNLTKENLMKLPPLKTPKDLYHFVLDKEQKYLWSTGKGSVRVENYAKRVKDFINGVSVEPITAETSEGHNNISLWQKAELEIRHQEQMKNLDKLIQEGVEYGYLSSHPNCSQRCEIWQGSLVSLTEHSINNPPKKVNSLKEIHKMDFFVRKKDGKNVYSLPDIMAVEDKYGYKNNIINGFNCRHHIIPYQKGVVPVNEFSAKEVATQREIETDIRAMEREIRVLKTKEKNYNVIGLYKEAEKLDIVIKRKVAIYKAYCERNGYAWYQYRIDV